MRYKSTPRLFPTIRKTLEHSTVYRAQKYFYLLETNPVVLKNGTEHAEPLFVTLILLFEFTWAELYLMSDSLVPPTYACK